MSKQSEKIVSFAKKKKTKNEKPRKQNSKLCLLIIFLYSVLYYKY